MRTDAKFPADVERLEDRVYSDAILILYELRETDRLAIDEDQLDFRMRHTEAFDQVFDSPRNEERPFEGSVSLFRRKMIV